MMDAVPSLAMLFWKKMEPFFSSSTTVTTNKQKTTQQQQNSRITRQCRRPVTEIFKYSHFSCVLNHENKMLL